MKGLRYVPAPPIPVPQIEVEPGDVALYEREPDFAGVTTRGDKTFVTFTSDGKPARPPMPPSRLAVLQAKGWPALTPKERDEAMRLVFERSR